MADKTGGPAFPVIGAPGAPEDYPGMWLRDYFAAKAPPPPKWWMDSYAKPAQCLDTFAQVVSQWAYAYADAMILERAK